MSTLTRGTTRLARRSAMWSLRRSAKMALAFAAGCLFGWWWDRPGMVKDRALESPFERRAQVSSACFWPTVAVWFAAGAPGCPGLVAALAGWLHLDVLPHVAWVIGVTFFAVVVLMRRLLAARGYGWKIRSLVNASRRWLRHYASLAVTLTVVCLVMPVWAMLAGWAVTPLGAAVPTTVLLAVGGFIAWREGAWWRRMERLRPALAQAHNVSEEELKPAVFMPGPGPVWRAVETFIAWRKRAARPADLEEGTAEAPQRPPRLVMTSVPPKVVTRLDTLQERIAIHLPQFEALVHKRPTGGVKSISYPPTSVKERTRRDVRDQTGKLVDAIEGEYALLADGVVESQAEEVDNALRSVAGLSVIEWDKGARRVRVAPLDDRTRRERSRIAKHRRCKPLEVEAVVTTEDDIVTGAHISRAPAITDSVKRRSEWIAVARALWPSPDRRTWTFREDSGRDEITLRLVADPLDQIVPFDEDVNEQVAVDEPWHIGVDEDGVAVEMDLAASAHMLIAGATRSGKSVCTYSLVTHVLRMGDKARLLVADPNDTTVAPFAEHCAWSTTSTHPDDVTAMLEWVRGEMDRRKPILRGMRQDKLNPEDFSAGLPMLVVVIDEAANYLRHSDKTAAKNLEGELLAVVSQGAKYGVRLVLITQRPDSTILPTSTRAQLSARISFRVEDRETALMAFPDLEEPEVLLTCKQGEGWIKEVAGRPRRFRSIYLSDHWAVASAMAYRQPPIEVAGAGDPVPAEPIPAESTDTNVKDLGEVEVSLVDLNNEVDEFEAPVKVTKKSHADLSDAFD